MNLSSLQNRLPWTIPYGEDFQRGKSSYSDMQHALMHIIKSTGILAGFIDKWDHGARPTSEEHEVIRKRVADFVMCALRIANVAPCGRFDLESTVIERMEAVNGVELANEGLRHELCNFAVDMEHKLREHDDRKLTFKSPTCKDYGLLVDLRSHQQQLQALVANPNPEDWDHDEIQKQCVHIGNYAMMMHYRAGVSKQ